MNRLLAIIACVLTLLVLPEREALALGATNACTWTSNFAATGSLIQGRAGHVATALADGKVLITGGSSSTSTTPTAELFNPDTGTYSVLPSMGTRRYFHTATRLNDGRVLIVGGSYGALDSGANATAEIYDPTSKTFSPVAPMAKARLFHTATLMSDGKVLVVGGTGPGGVVAEVELFDPATRAFSILTRLQTPRSNHTATRLLTSTFPGDEVLIAGGRSSIGMATAVEGVVYHLLAGTGGVRPQGTLQHGRADHTATMLAGGEILLVGGADSSYRGIASVESWHNGASTTVAQLNHARTNHMAVPLPTGQVLVGGGLDNDGVGPVELYTPGTGFKDIGSLATPRFYLAAAELPGGQVLFTGGFDSSGLVLLSSSEIYDPFWAGVGPMNEARSDHSATLLPGGKVLLAGGSDTNNVAKANAELFDPVTLRFSLIGMNSAHAKHTATSLRGGEVLIAGGQTSTGTFLNTAEVFDPGSVAFVASAPMTTARLAHGATLLQDGRVLVAGGYNPTSLSSSEFFSWNSASRSGNFATGPAMVRDRFGLGLTKLDNGQVLATGGRSTAAGGIAYSVENFDLASSAFTLLTNLMINRQEHTVMPLPGQPLALVAGGITSGITPTASFELVPQGGQGQMLTPRFLHAMTRTASASSSYWVIGGKSTYSGVPLNTVEALNTDQLTTKIEPELPTGVQRATATLLADGRVLVAGGLRLMDGTTASALISKSTACMSMKRVRAPRKLAMETLAVHAEQRRVYISALLGNVGQRRTAAIMLRFDLLAKEGSEDRATLGSVKVPALYPRHKASVKSSFVLPARLDAGVVAIQACVPPTPELAGRCFEVSAPVLLQKLAIAKASKQFPIVQTK